MAFHFVVSFFIHKKHKNTIFTKPDEHGAWLSTMASPARLNRAAAAEAALLLEREAAERAAQRKAMIEERRKESGNEISGYILKPYRQPPKPTPVTMNAIRRMEHDEVGKYAAKKLRKEEKTLGTIVMPGDSTARVPIKMDKWEWRKQCQRGNLFSRIMLVRVEEDKWDEKNQKHIKIHNTYKCIVGKMTQDTVTEETMEVTFVKFEPGRKMKVNIPIVIDTKLEASCPGVMHGGRLFRPDRTIPAYFCGPEDELEETIELDPRNLDIGSRVTWEDIETPSKKYLTPIKKNRRYVFASMKGVKIGMGADDDDAQTASSTKPAAAVTSATAAQPKKSKSNKAEEDEIIRAKGL